MSLVLLLLVLATDPPPASDPTGAKAMFKDPSLNAVHFSPRGSAEKPPGKTLPAEAPEKMPNDRPRRAALPTPLQAPAPSPARRAEPVRSIGVRFWVQQVDDRGTVLGDAQVGQVFHSGDRIQLVVESNTEGYLAVVQQGSDGHAGLLFPRAGEELGRVRIPAHAKVVLPDNEHSFTFDERAGTERLLIVLAREREELDVLPLRGEMSSHDLVAVQSLAASEFGAKNLVVQAFADPEEDPATYVVNRAGRVIVQEIALVHED
ncbi:MAG TPA: DUF4384 domain-containing protein [Thermoanaerobaculia bacterium]|nr:DUF4384 domain-containing protein [Thermoanaerobaculia bacterium]